MTDDGHCEELVVMGFRMLRVMMGRGVING